MFYSIASVQLLSYCHLYQQFYSWHIGVFNPQPC